jgi:hypothetical protein
MTVELGKLNAPLRPEIVEKFRQRGENPEAEVLPEHRDYFESCGWRVSGIVSNADGLGKHRLKMMLPLVRSKDGIATPCIRAGN